MKRIFTLVVLALPALQAQPKPKTVLDGVYTEAQAKQGMDAYEAKCASCHKQTLDGGAEALPLRDVHFLETWRDDTLEPLFNHMATRMPRRPVGEPGTLPANTYVDIIAYILKVNEYPAGQTELTKETLSTVLLVGKDGPRPLPTNASVQVVGCLTPAGGDNWQLTKAGDLSRTRNTAEITPEELKAAANRPLGTQKFRLANLDDFKPNFDPKPLKDQKVFAKGALSRSSAGDRIFVLSLEPVSPCN
jgi:mono/diheme cytochrome c family protein